MKNFQEGDEVVLKDGRYTFLGKEWSDLAERIGRKLGTIAAVNSRDTVRVRWETVDLLPGEGMLWGIDTASLQHAPPLSQEEVRQAIDSIRQASGVPRVTGDA